MKQFARRIPSEEILHQGGAKISSRTIKLLIDKTDNLEEHMWYTQQKTDGLVQCFRIR